MGMLGKNVSTEEGESGILNALNKHNGGIFDHLSDFLGSGEYQTETVSVHIR